ncbi:MAG: hypothetical protein FJW92_06515 [Actinobacteria bacterium]|nr:hypothetical protein [Actinomycetota bacterium]
MNGVGIRVRRAAGALLSANWREGVARTGVAYGYTCPDGAKYPYQWFWDSLMHALAWNELDPARAAAEVRSLAALQRPDGLIGHTIFWDAPVRLARLAFYSVRSRADIATATIQPPFLGWAWAEIAEQLGDAAFAEQGRDVVRAYNAWIERERVDSTGLAWVILPDETGCDASPVFDQALGWRRHGTPGFAVLVDEARRQGYSFRRIRARGGFTAACPLVNASLALGYLGLHALGEPGARERAREITDGIVEHLWDERSGIFRLAGPDGLPVPVSAWQGLAPAALPDLPEQIRARVVDDWLLRGDRFWPAHPVPSVSLDDPAFMPGDGRLIPQYWRGPSWPFTPPFMILALLLAGRRAEAAALVSRIEERLDAQGFREYTDPIDGTGMGARAFASQAVILALHAWMERVPIPVRAAIA